MKELAGVLVYALPAAVGEALVGLDGENEPLRRLAQHGHNGALGRQAVVREVDLHEGELPGVPGEHVLAGKARGVERPHPVLVAVAGGSDKYSGSAQGRHLPEARNDSAAAGPPRRTDPLRFAGGDVLRRARPRFLQAPGREQALPAAGKRLAYGEKRFWGTEMDKGKLVDIRARKDDRQAALERAIAEIEKQSGRGSIMLLGEAQAILNDVIKRGTDVVGSRVRAKVVKNKLAPPFRQADFYLIYGEGISREGSLPDLAVALGVPFSPLRVWGKDCGARRRISYPGDRTKFRPKLVMAERLCLRAPAEKCS